MLGSISGILSDAYADMSETLGVCFEFRALKLEFGLFG